MSFPARYEILVVFASDEEILDLCNSLNELSEQEKTVELLPIGVQQLYVLSKLGKTEEAEKVASQISLQQ